MVVTEKNAVFWNEVI